MAPRLNLRFADKARCMLCRGMRLLHRPPPPAPRAPARRRAGWTALALIAALLVVGLLFDANWLRPLIIVGDDYGAPTSSWARGATS